MRRRFEKIPTIHNAAKRSIGKYIFFSPNLSRLHSSSTHPRGCCLGLCYIFPVERADGGGADTHTRACSYTRARALMSAVWRAGENNFSETSARAEAQSIMGDGSRAKVLRCGLPEFVSLFPIGR